MSHWAAKYIGGEWTPEHDCWWWFCKISREIYGRQFPCFNTSHQNKLHAAARIMNSNTVVSIGWRSTSTPMEGDAVFLSKSKKVNTHIGIVFYSRKKRHVIHALENIGVVAHSVTGQRIAGLIVKGYWTYANFF